MDIILLQSEIKWKEPATNRTHIEQLLSDHSSADLILFPEMFTTGFCMTPKDVAEKADTETLQWMQKLAKDKNAAIAGSVATEENGKYYNRLYFVKPNGEYTTYDKKHLFTYSGEHKEYLPGNERVIVEHNGLRILLQICYDLRFPVFSRNKGDYDMILYVANWPTSRLYAWDTLLHARAIENQCYVAGVNCTGHDPSNKYSGGTTLIDYMGQPIVTAEPYKEDVISASINIEDLKKFRESFPALNDADQFTIIE